MDSSRTVSIAIPTFNRFALLCEAVSGILNDPRVGEIVVSDDCSTDGSYHKIRDYFKDNVKFKIHQNKTNQDCYGNKAAAVSRVTGDWVILLDDDNMLSPVYLDKLYQLASWDANTIYCPDFAQPHFDYRIFSGVTATKQNICGLMDLKHFPTLLNTANYFVHRSNYLKVWDGSVNPHTADSLFMAYNWLASGRKLHVLPGLRYFHRVHEGSHYKRNLHKTGNLAQEIRLKLKQLR